MRKLTVVAALLSAAAVPSAASAQVFVGVRLGYALPWGDFTTNAPVKDLYESQIPATLDLGLKLGPALAVGAYASYAVAQLSNAYADACDLAGATCSAADLRLGVQLNLHAVNGEASELWGGVAVGYEELRMKEGGADGTFKGYDATLQGGIDFLTSPNLRIGPFASVTVGRFDKLERTTEVEIADKELHGWFQVGLRGMFAN